MSSLEIKLKPIDEQLADFTKRLDSVTQGLAKMDSERETGKKIDSSYYSSQNKVKEEILIVAQKLMKDYKVDYDRLDFLYDQDKKLVLQYNSLIK